MAAPVVSPAPRRRRVWRIVLRVLAALVLLALLAVAVFAGWAYRAAKAALPQLDGRLAVAGLSAPVRVVRDRQGVPHLTAQTLDDLFFAQGFVTAQDRLWQMDITRRAAAGELAEVMGDGLLRHDRRQRILGLRLVAERAALELIPQERAHVEAYARGVNAFIEQARDGLPIEFRLLRYQPRSWTATDSILVITFMHQMLNDGFWRDELVRERILGRIGPQLAAELYPNSSWRDVPPSAKPLSIVDEEEEEPAPAPRKSRRRGRARSSAALAPAELPSRELVPGSNNWVVSGAHTATGRPLLSNDMHLPHRIPDTWYEAHLESGDLNVIGVTLPGVPYVVVGHNQRIAWGFTNIGPDVQDVYIENFNSAGEYQTPQGWLAPERRTEVIKVKGEADVSLEVLATRHGPIITSLIPGEQRQLALRWTLYDPGSVTAPFYQINIAGNWTEFRAALARFSGPGQNVVYGDVDGFIGYQATGRVPTRAGAYDGSLPVPGHTDDFEWTGALAFDALPSVFNPPSGVLATANGRITPSGYPHNISTQWGPPYRTERIYRVLSSGKKFTAADMLALQADVYSTFERFVAQRLAYAVDQTPSASGRAREAADLLRSWDGKVTAASAAPTLAAIARRRLMRLVLEPKLGELHEQYSWFMSSVWMENLLLKQPAHWLPDKYSNYHALLTAALEYAVDHKDAPGKLDSWSWGRYYPVELNHPIFGQVPLLNRWTGPGRRPQNGSGYTVTQVGREFGPSERMTVDFANLDASTLNIVTGQSGHLLSPHYMDQWTAWLSATTFPLAYSRDAVEKAKAHELVLEPK